MTAPTSKQKAGIWQRLSLPQRSGLVAALIALLLVLIGVARGTVPFHPLNILVAMLISAVSWGLVAWAVATAAVDVESDINEP